MKILNFIKVHVLYPACLYTVFISIMLFLLSIGSSGIPAIHSSIYITVFAYCIVLALTNLILHVKKLNSVLRFFLHFVTNVGAFFLLMKITFAFKESNEITQLGVSARQYIVGFILFIFLYLIIFLFRLLIHHVAGRKREGADEYKPMF